MRLLKSTFMAAIALLPLAGCTTGRQGEPAAMWREMARAYQVGVTYDQALIALRQEDGRKLRRKLRDLDDLDAAHVSARLQLERAEDRVRQAVMLEGRSMRLGRGQYALKQQLMAQAMHEYRSALRSSPNFPSQNPLLLNALGYHLADRGRNAEDYTLAVELTTRAVAMLSKLIERSGNLGLSKSSSLAQLEQQQAITRDSLAWGLYKLNRFKEAEAVQLQALKQAKKSGLQDAETLAELWWHQAYILQGQGRSEDAQTALKEAQRLQLEERRFQEPLD